MVNAPKVVGCLWCTDEGPSSHHYLQGICCAPCVYGAACENNYTTQGGATCCPSRCGYQTAFVAATCCFAVGVSALGMVNIPFPATLPCMAGIAMRIDANKDADKTKRVSMCCWSTYAEVCWLCACPCAQWAHQIDPPPAIDL